MTYNEIIVALECCSEKNGESCELKCPIFCLGNCRDDLHEAALDLIERQQAEIAKAKSEAITEFVEKLKDYAWYYDVDMSALDRLEKEMLEALNGTE